MLLKVWPASLSRMIKSIQRLKLTECDALRSHLLAPCGSELLARQEHIARPCVQLRMVRPSIECGAVF